MAETDYTVSFREPIGTPNQIDNTPRYNNRALLVPLLERYFMGLMVSRNVRREKRREDERSANRFSFNLSGNEKGVMPKSYRRYDFDWAYEINERPIGRTPKYGRHVLFYNDIVIVTHPFLWTGPPLSLNRCCYAIARIRVQQIGTFTVNEKLSGNPNGNVRHRPVY